MKLSNETGVKHLRLKKIAEELIINEVELFKQGRSKYQAYLSIKRPGKYILEDSKLIYHYKSYTVYEGELIVREHAVPNSLVNRRTIKRYFPSKPDVENHPDYKKEKDE